MLGKKYLKLVASTLIFISSLDCCVWFADRWENMEITGRRRSPRSLPQQSVASVECFILGACFHIIGTIAALF